MDCGALTIDELADEAAAVLEHMAVGPRNGQVGERPDRRMLRYYSSLGMLDSPDDVRGRTALYGHRHVLQVVAVKRLQADGLSLADIQRRLAGASNEELAAQAGLDGASASRAQSRRPEFWRKTAAAGLGSSVPTPAAAPVRKEGSSPKRAPAAEIVPGVGPSELSAVSLGDGVILLLPVTRALRSAELAALGVAAAPLLDHLTTTGLLRRPDDENGELS